MRKNYNNQVFGTETPNVVQIIKGRGNKEAKKSSLRKKALGNTLPQTQTVEVSEKKEAKDSMEIKQYIPFFKSFFH